MTDEESRDDEPTVDIEAGGPVGDGDSPDADAEYLAEVDDGCGCAEIWEHLSERRSDD